MNYWLAIIILIELKEYKCCGPAGTPVDKCTEWNQVTFAGSLAENMTIYSTTEFKMSSLFKSRKMEEQKFALLQYYVSFGVDLMQLKVYEIINYELQKNSSEPLYFLFAESSYKVSRYYFRTHNYEKGLTFVKNAITKIEQLPVDGFFCSHKLSMWLAYLRGSQIDIMKSIENNNEIIDIINSRRRDDFNKAFMKYQLLLKERNFNRDSRMEFLIGKEYLKVVDAHIPLNEDYLKLKKNYAIETGIEWLEKYENKFINPSNLIESSFILGNIYMKLDQKNYAKYHYLKAIKEPVKNAEDRALNYEIAKTIAKFFYGVINDLDEEVENNFNSFWEILQSTPDKFEPSIVNNFVRTVTKHNSKYVTKSSVDKITDDIIDKGINALEKIQYSQSLYEYYKWSAVLSSAKCYSTTKSRAHLDLKINLEGALSNKSELDDENDIHLTYLVGKYACEIRIEAKIKLTSL
ncbi:uncharacterized protein LOC126897618 isoform X2 [Daktulosphaira vitifoliae]|uniref:uncharacterized protein LOC126897618 isoform X2 n=1 Tax=Daktulosphaira vitifoliae TaxID=58002 RepID=UPI0021AA925C|nr:uncharacterized protein LOC126897618 isoform X2 [Daktulosphaira vitifoliae]